MMSRRCATGLGVTAARSGGGCPQDPSTRRAKAAAEAKTNAQAKAAAEAKVVFTTMSVSLAVPI